MKITAQVVFKEVTFLGVGQMQGWRVYNVVVDKTKYTAAGDFKTKLRLTIPPDTNIEPVVGDQMLIRQLKPGLWIPCDSFFNGLEPYQYIRNTDEKHLLEVNGEEVELYKMPDFAKTLFFEIKPVKVYYNPITEVSICETVAGDSFELYDNPDRLLFSVYERLRGKTQSTCIGDWDSFYKAWMVYEHLNMTLSFTKKLSK